MSYRFTFYGGAQEVGRSCIKVEKEGRALYLDCGIKLPGPELPLAEERHPVVVSHAHLDHIGFLPHLKPLVHTTKVTRELMPVLLADYQRLSGLIGKEDVRELMGRVEQHAYEPFSLNGFAVELFNAGHILGSAMVRLDGKVLYTGDFNVRGSRLLEGAKPVKAEVLIMESTYAGREDFIPPLRESIRELMGIVKETLQRGGVAIIPSFAVGRAQEVLLALESYMRSGALPRAPIYIDGMIKKVMRIYRKNVTWAKRSVQLQILESLHDPFQSELFHTPRRIDRSDVKGPAVVVTTSGMLTGGPVVHYLKLFGRDGKSALILVGYQAEGTPGRALLEGKQEVCIGEECIAVEIPVHYVRISGHADRRDLERFVHTVKPETLILVHGEEKKMKAFAEDMAERYSVIVPSLGEEVRV